MPHTLEQDLQHYFSLLLPSEQQSIVSLVKTFASGRTEQEVSLEQYNKELEDANAEIDNGNFITHEEVKKRLLK